MLAENTLPLQDEETINPYPKGQILESSKLKELADDNLRFDENGNKFSKKVETLWVKDDLLFMSNFSCSHSVFKRLVPQTCKNQDLFRKELTYNLE